MWQRLRPREKFMLSILVFAGLCSILFKFILIPQYNIHIKSKARLADLRLKLQADKDVIRTQQQEIDEAVKVTEQLNEIKPLFNNEMGDGLALVQIGLQAVESNVDVLSFIPSVIVDKGDYLELPFRMEVRGDYYEVCSFIKKIEALPNLSEIRTLIIKHYEDKKAVMPADSAALEQIPGEKTPEEVIPVQDGRVVAKFDIVTFTSPSPEAKLQVEQALKWAVGRYNAFRPPDAVSPYPGIKPMVIKAGQSAVAVTTEKTRLTGATGDTANKETNTAKEAGTTMVLPNGR
ncbi:MAG: Pilus assembly protein, PilO [Pelotomaculum sp. PtaU1.Bin035]|nr:MAG: Pilus assembly protein, PilO [Pelotomaculum sp. PtaU1.Bin035]